MATVEIFTELPDPMALLTCEAEILILKGSAAVAWFAIASDGAELPAGCQVVGTLRPMPPGARELLEATLAEEMPPELLAELDLDEARVRHWTLERVQ